MKSIVYEGILQTYFETGMEQLGFHLFINQDKYKTLNVNYDPKSINSGPLFYQSWDGTIVLKKKDKIEIIDCPITKYNGKIFTLGNLSLARKDESRLSVYPEESIDLKDWYTIFACEKTVAKVYRPLNRISYYGGTFDPVHVGHKKVIQELVMSADLVLIMPGNNWTKKQPTFSLEERVNSLKAVCDQWPNVQVLDWAQGNRFDTSSTYQVVKEIEKEFEIRPEIVIGSDNVQNIEKWKKWEDLKDYRFYIINRGGNLSKEDLAKFKNPIYHSSFRPHVISSSEIRSKIDLIEQIPLEARSHLDLKKLSQNES